MLHVLCLFKIPAEEFSKSISLQINQLLLGKEIFQNNKSVADNKIYKIQLKGKKYRKSQTTANKNIFIIVTVLIYFSSGDY